MLWLGVGISFLLIGRHCYVDVVGLGSKVFVGVVQFTPEQLHINMSFIYWSMVSYVGFNKRYILYNKFNCILAIVCTINTIIIIVVVKSDALWIPLQIIEQLNDKMENAVVYVM